MVIYYVSQDAQINHLFLAMSVRVCPDEISSWIRELVKVGWLPSSV